MVEITTPENVDLVLAHSPCLDGFTAEWLVHLARGNDVEIRGVSHEDPAPDVTGRHVAVLDFVFKKRSDMERMASQAASIVILDHHETNERKLEGLPYAIFDMGRSGAQMTYDWCSHLIKDERTRAVAQKLAAFVQERDLWRFALPGSREVGFAMMAIPYTFDAWSDFASRLYVSQPLVVAGGAAIAELMAAQLAGLASTAKVGLVDGVPAWVANAPYAYASDLGMMLVQQPGPGVAAIWRYNHSSGTVAVSLRSSVASGVNVALLGERRGGGGHARAAGFEVHTSPDVLPFFEEIPGGA